jgi:hypothetical protein
MCQRIQAVVLSGMLLIVFSGISYIWPAIGDAGAPAGAGKAKDTLRKPLQEKFDQLRAQGKFSGATAGFAFADGSTLGLATGISDRETGTAGSRGKVWPGGNHPADGTRHQLRAQRVLPRLRYRNDVFPAVQVCRCRSGQH